MNSPFPSLMFMLFPSVYVECNILKGSTYLQSKSLISKPEIRLTPQDYTLCIIITPYAYPFNIHLQF